ncbi:MAG: hypothetical protein R3E50_02360 [Halioglobus sp.]
MRDSVALQRYLQRHTEPGLPRHDFSVAAWDQVLVVPAYRESPALLDTLRQLPAGQRRTLVILVLNRPDSDGDTGANAALRRASAERGTALVQRCSVPVYPLNPHADLYLHDLEMQRGPNPAAQGVGLARKSGFDLALQWMAAGGISGRWLCSTDADATLPPDYFQQLDGIAPEAVAAVFPFRHVPGSEPSCDAATALYELRLHHHVLGLEYAGSPYAHHALGSCLAVRADAYAQVRGFPKRGGAEDFYLLNKLAKIGPIARSRGGTVRLASRRSCRVPFGTGPGVAAILAAGRPEAAAVFYHPLCYAALRALLACIPTLAPAPGQELTALLVGRGLDAALARRASAALDAMGLHAALAHCARQSRSNAQFLRQFHQWFDAFRTLKLIHALRDGGWPQQSLTQLVRLSPQLWPGPMQSPQAVEELRMHLADHWGWQWQD